MQTIEQSVPQPLGNPAVHGVDERPLTVTFYYRQVTFFCDAILCAGFRVTLFAPS